MPRTRLRASARTGSDVAAVAHGDVPVGEEPVGLAALEGALEVGDDAAAALADLAPETA